MLTVTKDGEIYEFETLLYGGVIMKNRFNYAQYRKYREANEHKQIPARDKRIKNHPLVGRAFLRDDGVIIIVEIVSKHWWFGFYEHVVYRIHNTRSHGTGVCKNISCVCDSIIESVAEFNSYKLLDHSNVPEETNVKLD